MPELSPPSAAAKAALGPMIAAVLVTAGCYMADPYWHDFQSQPLDRALKSVVRVKADENALMGDQLAVVLHPERRPAALADAKAKLAELDATLAALDAEVPDAAAIKAAGTPYMQGVRAYLDAAPARSVKDGRAAIIADVIPRHEAFGKSVNASFDALVERAKRQEAAPRRLPLVGAGLGLLLALWAAMRAARAWKA